jgi:putative membrane protein
MDERVLDELQDTIDEELGRGYQLHSFVDPTNTNVREVQFVYVVDGVSDSSDSSSADGQTSQATDDSQQSQSFLDRLTALFTK